MMKSIFFLQFALIAMAQCPPKSLLFLGGLKNVQLTMCSSQETVDQLLKTKEGKLCEEFNKNCGLHQVSASTEEIEHSDKFLRALMHANLLLEITGQFSESKEAMEIAAYERNKHVSVCVQEKLELAERARFSVAFQIGRNSGDFFVKGRANEDSDEGELSNRELFRTHPWDFLRDYLPIKVDREFPDGDKELERIRKLCDKRPKFSQIVKKHLLDFENQKKCVSETVKKTRSCFNVVNDRALRLLLKSKKWSDPKMAQKRYLSTLRYCAFEEGEVRTMVVNKEEPHRPVADMHELFTPKTTEKTLELLDHKSRPETMMATMEAPPIRTYEQAPPPVTPVTPATPATPATAAASAPITPVSSSVPLPTSTQAQAPAPLPTTTEWNPDTPTPSQAFAESTSAPAAPQTRSQLPPAATEAQRLEGAKTLESAIQDVIQHPGKLMSKESLPTTAQQEVMKQDLEQLKSVVANLSQGQNQAQSARTSVMGASPIAEVPNTPSAVRPLLSEDGPATSPESKRVKQIKDDLSSSALYWIVKENSDKVPTDDEVQKAIEEVIARNGSKAPLLVYPGYFIEVYSDPKDQKKLLRDQKGKIIFKRKRIKEEVEVSYVQSIAHLRMKDKNLPPVPMPPKSQELKRNRYVDYFDRAHL